MKNKKNLENELKAIIAMVKMRLVDMEQLENILRELSKKYDMPIILRDRNITTNKRTIKVIA